jgi:hypothetical protein
VELELSWDVSGEWTVGGLACALQPVRMRMGMRSADVVVIGWDWGRGKPPT